MAEINKPSDINKIWASAGDVLAPSDSKIATGWSVEIPPVSGLITSIINKTKLLLTSISMVYLYGIIPQNISGQVRALSQSVWVLMEQFTEQSN